MYDFDVFYQPESGLCDNFTLQSVVIYFNIIIHVPVILIRDIAYINGVSKTPKFTKFLRYRGRNARLSKGESDI